MKDVIHLIDDRPVRVEIHTLGTDDPDQAARQAVERLKAVAESPHLPAAAAVEVENDRMTVVADFEGVRVAFSLDLQPNTIARTAKRFIFPRDPESESGCAAKVEAAAADPPVARASRP